ncbi:hypothetical protein ScPMuIL_015533 [Solemya velum]
MNTSKLWATLICVLYLLFSVYGLIPVSIDEECKASNSSILPNPDICHGYYECEFSQARSYHCDYPDLFSTESMECEWFDNVTCGSRPEYTECTDYSTSWCSRCPPCARGCKGKSDGNHTYLYREWSPYYVNETFIERVKCDDWLQFDVLTSSCQTARNSTTPCGPKPPFRLIGGKTESEGRIEVFNKAEWGAVCATDWDKKGATATLPPSLKSKRQCDIELPTKRPLHQHTPQAGTHSDHAHMYTFTYRRTHVFT